MRPNLSVFGARFSQFPKRIASITSSRLSSQWLARQTRLDLSLSSTLFGFFDSLTVPRMRMNPRVRSDRTFGLDNTLEFRSLALLVLSVEVARTRRRRRRRRRRRVPRSHRRCIGSIAHSLLTLCCRRRRRRRRCRRDGAFSSFLLSRNSRKSAALASRKTTTAAAAAAKTSPPPRDAPKKMSPNAEH